LQSTEQKVKELLAANTAKAVEDGAFGLPWFECTNVKGETQGHWGVDHLGFVVDFLGLERGLDKGFRPLL
jgi:2-hydroxychromene-2-carboxylate isomerase